MGIEQYDHSEQKIFIDSSEKSLKSLLLHNGNLSGVFPMVHSVHLEEDYGHIKIVLDLLKYDEHKWVIWADRKLADF